MKWRINLLIICLLISIVSVSAVTTSSSTLNWLTKNSADRRFCLIDGTNCLLGNASTIITNASLWGIDNGFLIPNQTVTGGFAAINITRAVGENLSLSSSTSLKFFANISNSAVELVSSIFRPLFDGLNDFTGQIDLLGWRNINASGSINATRVCNSNGVCVGDIISTKNLTNDDNFQNSTQVNESIEDLGNQTFMRIDALNGPFTGTVGFGGNNITNLGVIFQSDGQLISRGTSHILSLFDVNFTGADDAFTYFDNATRDGPVFVWMRMEDVIRAVPKPQDDKGTFMLETHLFSRQFGIMNISELTDCPFMIIQNWGLVQRIGCLANVSGAGVGIEGSLQVGQKVFIGGGNLSEEGIRVEGAADFFMKNGADFGVFNGTVHITDFRIEEQGFSAGQRVNFFIESFDTGNLNKFRRIDDTGNIGEWTVVSDINCFNDQCAQALGGAGSPQRIMEANFTTMPFNDINLTFILSVDQNGVDLFNVTMNNNTGSGEVNLFNQSSDTFNQSVKIALPSSMFNITQVSLRFYYQANNQAQDSLFVNDIVLDGNATQSTLVNVTIEDGKIEFGDDTCTIEINGSNPQTMTLGANSNCNVIIPNATIISQTVGEQNITGDLNVEGNLNVGGNITQNGIALGANFSNGGVFEADTRYNDNIEAVVGTDRDFSHRYTTISSDNKWIFEALSTDTKSFDFMGKDNSIDHSTDFNVNMGAGLSGQDAGDIRLSTSSGAEPSGIIFLNPGPNGYVQLVTNDALTFRDKQINMSSPSDGHFLQRADIEIRTQVGGSFTILNSSGFFVCGGC